MSGVCQREKRNLAALTLQFKEKKKTISSKGNLHVPSRKFSSVKTTFYLKLRC